MFPVGPYPTTKHIMELCDNLSSFYMLDEPMEGCFLGPKGLLWLLFGQNWTYKLQIWLISRPFYGNNCGCVWFQCPELNVN